MRWSLCSVVCVGALVGGACAVPQRHADASWRRLEDMGRAGLKETVKAKMAAEGELEVRDENGTVVLYETVEERIEGLKEIVLEKQRALRDFILDQGIDEKAEIMAMQDELQRYEREYKSLVIANTPPTPSPYEDGTGECVTERMMWHADFVRERRSWGALSVSDIIPY